MAGKRIAKSPDVLETLIRVGNLFNTERDFDKLLVMIVHETIKLLEADRASVFILDEEKREIWSKIATGLNRGQVIRTKMNEGIVGSVVTTGKALNISDAYADPRFNREIDLSTGYDTKNILCFPIVTFEGRILGAFQVLNKKGGPFTHEDEQVLTVLSSQACVAIENVQEYEQSVRRGESLSSENSNLKKQLEGKYAYPAIVGDSKPIADVKNAIDKVATTTANVLITGESGTGKELIARAIHSKSLRADKRFIALNCASLPESLLEPELFGIEKGIATGVSKRKGYFELAHEGTLFLDEIGEMTMGMQAKLLRALQEHSILRVGGAEEIPVDVRVIAATNHDFTKVIQTGEFREDLYYRLNVFPIHVPTLRERVVDIPVLANFILGKIAKKMNLPDKSFDEESVEAMMGYSWPGNVRELENVIERAVILGEGAEVDMVGLLSGTGGSFAGGVPPGLSHPASQTTGTAGDHIQAGGSQNMKEAVKSLEMTLISSALQKTRGNQNQAAKFLGISREGLRKKLARYEMAGQQYTNPA